MSELSVNRTLVKSPPELWSELSEVERLANHLGAFGEIRINRLEPEHTVAWEGEHACGTVEIEASGWGTKVTMKAEVREPEAPPAPEPVATQPAPPPPPRPTVHQVIPDLEAWDRAAAEIESQAQRQTAAAQRAAERAAERAQRERKGGLARWLFRSRRVEPEPIPEEPTPLPPPPPPAPSAHWSDAVQAAEPPPAPEPAAPLPATEPAVDEDRARAVLEAALDNLGAAHHRPFSRG